MTKTLREVMREKPEGELMNYLNNYTDFIPEAIIAAVDELKRRGKVFTEPELNSIQIKIEERKKAEDEEEPSILEPSSPDNDLVSDPDAPLLYSKGAIGFFSFIFNALFGAVLLSYNIKPKKGKWVVLGFGIIYTIFSILIFKYIRQNWSLVYFLNLAGGMALTTTFWDKYVGKGIKYRAKAVWIPLIISLLIVIPIILFIIFYQ